MDRSEIVDIVIQIQAAHEAIRRLLKVEAETELRHREVQERVGSRWAPAVLVQGQGETGE